MTDIVDWLYEAYEQSDDESHFLDAADEIGRLRNALERIIGLDTHVGDGGKVHDHGSYAQIAIEALTVVGAPTGGDK